MRTHSFVAVAIASVLLLGPSNAMARATCSSASYHGGASDESALLAISADCTGARSVQIRMATDTVSTEYVRAQRRPGGFWQALIRERPAVLAARDTRRLRVVIRADATRWVVDCHKSRRACGLARPARRSPPAR